MAQDAVLGLPNRNKKSAAAVVALTAMRLLLPVAAMLAALAAAQWGMGITITALDGIFSGETWLKPSQWLTAGHLLLALVFLAGNLASRRYGVPIAMLQIIVSAVFAALFLAFVQAQPASPVSVAVASYLGDMPPMRLATAFAGALILALLFQAVIFEWTRGVQWWKAPLYGALWGAIVFGGAFYSAAFAGGAEPWLTRMMLHVGLLALCAFVALLPYWILRALVRPLPGFGGY